MQRKKLRDLNIIKSEPPKTNWQNGKPTPTILNNSASDNTALHLQCHDIQFLSRKQELRIPASTKPQHLFGSYTSVNRIYQESSLWCGRRIACVGNSQSTIDTFLDCLNNIKHPSNQSCPQIVWTRFNPENFHKHYAETASNFRPRADAALIIIDVAVDSIEKDMRQSVDKHIKNLLPTVYANTPLILIGANTHLHHDTKMAIQSLKKIAEEYNLDGYQVLFSLSEIEWLRTLDQLGNFLLSNTTFIIPNVRDEEDDELTKVKCSIM